MKPGVYLVVTGLAIWAICGAIMAIGPAFMSMEGTLVTHLVGAPVAAIVLSFIYFRAFPGTWPLVAALVVVGLALALDALLVAPVLLRDWGMFASPIGLWVPMALIFVSVLFTGFVARSGQMPS